MSTTSETSMQRKCSILLTIFKAGGNQMLRSSSTEKAPPPPPQKRTAVPSKLVLFLLLPNRLEFFAPFVYVTRT